MLQNSFSANNVTATNELWFRDMCYWIYILENLSFFFFSSSCAAIETTTNRSKRNIQHCHANVDVAVGAVLERLVFAVSVFLRLSEKQVLVINSTSANLTSWRNNCLWIFKKKTNFRWFICNSFLGEKKNCVIAESKWVFKKYEWNWLMWRQKKRQKSIGIHRYNDDVISYWTFLIDVKCSIVI